MKKVYEIYIGDLKYLTIADYPEEALSKGYKYREERNSDGSFPKVSGVMCLGKIDF